MRVVRVVEFGGPEVLIPGFAADPVAGPGQVEVAVAGMTFVETQIRRGVDRWHERPRLPYVPGGLVAGRVSAIGAGADGAWLGRRVVAGTGETGGFAERDGRWQVVALQNARVVSFESAGALDAIHLGGASR